VARYEPKTSAAKVQLQRDFAQSKLSSVDDDPDAWISNLERIRIRLREMGDTIEDRALMVHIFNNLPREYESLIETMEKELDNNLTLAEVREWVRAKYARFESYKETTNETKGEAALVTKGTNNDNNNNRGKKTFKGRCRICGRYGHKGEDCWHNKDNRNGNKNNNSNNNTDRGNDGNHMSRGRRFDGNCHYCGKYGHRSADCWNKKRDESKRNDNNDNDDNAEVVLMAITSNMTFDTITKMTWIGDTGATTHMTNSLDGLFDIQDTNSGVKVGNGAKLVVTKVGKMRGVIKQKNGDTHDILLTKVKYVPDLWCNLFSITAAMTQGFAIESNGLNIVVKKGQFKLIFDKKIKTNTGFLLGVDIMRKQTEAVTVMMEGSKISYKKFHQMLAHPGMWSETPQKC